MERMRADSGIQLTFLGLIDVVSLHQKGILNEMDVMHETIEKRLQVKMKSVVLSEWNVLSACRIERF